MPQKAHYENSSHCLYAFTFIWYITVYLIWLKNADIIEHNLIVDPVCECVQWSQCCLQISSVIQSCHGKFLYVMKILRLSLGNIWSKAQHGGYCSDGKVVL